jgi:serine protease Do
VGGGRLNRPPGGERWGWPGTSCVLSLLVLSAPSQADISKRRSAVVEVVQKVSPAVVFIGTEQGVDRRLRGGAQEEPSSERGGARGRSVQSLGSGVLIDASGLVVTNDHVIRGASAIHVVLADGRELDAEVVGSDAGNDLAVLHVQGKGPFPAARLGTSADLMIGETVVAIGSPLGLQKTVTVGVLSATGRSFKADNDQVFDDFLQTDAAINPGNSGGPLLNLDGDVIGINSAILASAHGIGFAIPVDKVRRIVNELKSFGKMRPAWVGLEAVPLTPGVARKAGWERTHGVLIAHVHAGSPAALAGVRPGDLVTDIAGSPVADVDDFNARLRGYPARASFPLSLFRAGHELILTVTPEKFPSTLVDGLAWERLGLKVSTGKGALVVVSVRHGSQAAQSGLQVGDLVTRLDNTPVATLEAFRDGLMSSQGRGVLLSVRRGAFTYPLGFRF